MPLRALLAGVAVACCAAGAEAADARHRFSIAPKSYADALIDLGVQANVSILGTAACGQDGRAALSGRYTLAEALDRLLDGAPCRYRMVDPRTVRITAAPAPPVAPARDHPAPQPMLVSELVVTATKRPVSLERLPAGVSAISGDQIALTGAADVGQTVGQAAGVLTTNLGPGRDKLLIRGLSDGAFTGRARSTVSTYLDQAPLNYNAPDPDLRLVDVERLEIVRGPQGALYGSGTLAGIYRIVTRKPDLTSLAAGIGATGAISEGGDPSHEVEGYVNLPLLQGRAALRLVAYHDFRGGYLDDLNRRQTNVDRTVRNGGRLALRLQLGEAWRVDALAATQHLRSDDAQYVIPAMGGRRASRIQEGHDNNFDHLGLTLAGEVGELSLSSSTAYVRHTFTSQYDASAALRTFGGGPNDLAAYLENTRVGMLVEDLVVRSRSAGRFGWLAGAFASLTLERSPSFVEIASPAGTSATVYREVRKDRLSEVAAYGETWFEFLPGWTVSAGGRLFESRVRTGAAIEVLPPGVSRLVARERTFQGFSPKISLQREFPDGGMVYLLMSEGYRPGGFSTAGLVPLREIRSSFRPDRLRNYEVGAKLRLFDGRMAIRSAAYYDDWKNIQTDQYRPTGLSYTANVGDARILGLETEVGYDWDFGLSVQLNALLTDARLRDTNVDFASQVIDALPGIPKTSGGLLAVYRRPLGDDLTLRLTGEAAYVGRTAVSFNAGLTPRVGRYVRARLAAELATEAWRAAVFVSNPLDDASDTFAYGNPFSFGQLRQVTPQRPRTIGVQLAATF